MVANSCVPEFVKFPFIAIVSDYDKIKENYKYSNRITG